MIHGRQSQGPLLLISNLKDRSEELCKSQGPFWLKSRLNIKTFRLLALSLSSCSELLKVPSQKLNVIVHLTSIMNQHNSILLNFVYPDDRKDKS